MKSFEFRTLVQVDCPKDGRFLGRVHGTDFSQYVPGLEESEKFCRHPKNWTPVPPIKITPCGWGCQHDSTQH